ncbi:hypothetical protein PAMA_002796 [Pampus argenteus]
MFFGEPFHCSFCFMFWIIVLLEDKSPSQSQVFSNQIKSNFIYIAQNHKIHLSQRALQSVQGVTPSVLRPSIRVRKNLPTKKPFNREKGGRNLRKSHRGGIPLPGRTDVQ